MDPAEIERDRVAALRSLKILDTPGEAIFDEVARLAAAIIGTPVAAISLIDEDRQWFKAAIGMDVGQTPRSQSLCSIAIRDSTVTVIPDARLDGRFCNHPVVSGHPGVRFYAGAPLLAEGGHAIGMLCIADYRPRALTPAQQETLRLLARHVMVHFELRCRLTDLSRVAQDTTEALQPLRKALYRREFGLHYQPQVDAAGNVCGLEALIRWEDPWRGIQPPSAFIPLLEGTDLMTEMGRWVVRQAADDYRYIKSHVGSCPRIAINLTPKELVDPRFLTHMRGALGERASDRVELDVEITEGAFVGNIERTVAVLNELRSMGVQVAIDDFGTGYSSLKHLSVLPVDVLKLDRHFVSNIHSSPNDMAIASAVISLAHGLGMKVVAEGVETREQRQLLGLLRCEMFQGWLYARPAPKDEIVSFLARPLAAESGVHKVGAAGRVPQNDGGKYPSFYNRERQPG